jgi:hypothetical protein
MQSWEEGEREYLSAEFSLHPCTGEVECTAANIRTYRVTAIEAEVVMLPVRLVAEIFGAEVEWFPQTRSLSISTDENEYRLYVDAPLPRGMGVPLFHDNRVFIPARFVREIFDITTYWNAESSTIYLFQLLD